MSKNKTLELEGFANLTADPKLIEKTGSNGIYYTLIIPVASSEKYTDKQGVERENVTYLSLFDTFKKNPVKYLKYLTKGKKVYFSGVPSLTTSEQNAKFYANLSVKLEYFNLLDWTENSTK